MKKIIVYFFLLLLLSAGGIAGYGFYQYQNFLQQPVFSNLPVLIEITKGNSYADFIQTVKAKGGSGSVFNWKLMARLNQLENTIKAGEFQIDVSVTPMSLIALIDQNKVKTYSITLIEGENWLQLKQKLQTSNLKQVALDMDDQQLITALAIESGHLEGQFLPETYQYVKGDSDIDVLLRAHADLKSALNKAWQNRDPKTKLKSPYELLILASIIEKETAQHSERNIISWVFHRRLNKGMKLQTDPTVIYGVGVAYAGDITTAHLRTDTPYNTYTRKGLPPTPIAMASVASIEAAAHPNQGKELFFVANRTGGHTFSETYEQHQKAVAAYLRGN